jgi:[ribosomal protein S18]-alanine N-acetyltransferase
MKILIRQAKFSDLSQIDALNRKSLAENYNREFWIEKFNLGKDHCFVAICANEIIGYIFCDQGFVISFAVHELYRSKGIGQELLHHCLNSMNNKIKLHVRVSNEAAIKLYKKIGFTEEERMKNYYLSPPEDAYLMKWEKSLSVKFTERKKMNI